MTVQKVTDWLIRNGIVQSNEKEIIEFGIEEGKWMILNIILSVILGILFGVFWQSIVFLITFGLLRIYAGGYHADTRFRCYVFSIAIMAISFFLIKHLDWTNLGYLSTVIFTGILIFVLAPVANEYKPLDSIEINVYKRKTRKIMILYYIILSIAMLLRFQTLVNSMVIMFVAVSVLLILGYIKQFHQNKVYKD